ncbi:hypothetical protein B0H66DRAFT_605502 [Apodospora peruviana]|uniref:DUF5672 domain-containing protein n=1 Tax=Apodospora peruviana TaxID=516989 RepID=A0AAE0M0M3_9PEZI|nr:hypothetical protein B0H66DRAFT_605502 [Apodospora peruviana]
MLDIGVSRRHIAAALTLLAFIWLLRFTVFSDGHVAPLLDSEHESDSSLPEPKLNETTNTVTVTTTTTTTAVSTSIPEPTILEVPRKYGQIIDRVATITDTLYTERLIPLILHYHAVLGPEWPIVFFTSNETLVQHIMPPPTNTTTTQGNETIVTTTPAGSAIWRRAVADGRITIRIIPDQFNLTSRNGVNLYLSRPWLWEQLAPATHVLIFQADAMICANSGRTVEDFLEWDMVGAPLHPRIHYYNGGLCLRNRTMIMEILGEGRDWEADTLSGNWTEGGEDIWFSKQMDLRGAHLPSAQEAMLFAAEHPWHIKDSIKPPFGYHKVHKYAAGKMEQIAQWCPEIALAAPGKLEPST